ncbi:CDP-diacylglycerol--serine O-phosphatidyltransferase 2-like [Triticum aestivum]|uniref:CDP-diacylglycerol--serine O-phosphatidyltransferase 2-like n=1 Tax=Triticum aestivum TaxID=4565 RepID=UPI001D027C9A|nr:CDP-diacylglycerol--serine O-phosphatidyltransferase 2-like [Triticum aestivum]
MSFGAFSSSSELLHPWHLLFLRYLLLLPWLFSVWALSSLSARAFRGKDQWQLFMGPLQFIQVLFLCVVFMMVELNTFFLKFCLWIPPRNPLVVYRLILWWLIAIPTIREYNSYLQDSKPVKKVGAFCWLSVAICIVELLICMKFRHGLFHDPMPTWLIIFWRSAGIAFVIFLLAWSWRNYQKFRRKNL